MKTFHQTTRSMLYIFWNIWKIFKEIKVPFLGQMLSDIKEIKVLGAYIFGGFMFVYIYSRNIDPIGTTGLRQGCICWVQWY